MSDFVTALVAFAGVVAGGYFNNFIGEDYRRFRDGQALAGALAGELKSHGTAIPTLKTTLENLLSRLEGPNGSLQVVQRDFESANSPVFDANVGRIGLLGPQLAEEVAYVYEAIRAFRMTTKTLAKFAHEVEPAHSAMMLRNALQLVENADKRGTDLVVALRAFAIERYRFPWSR
ncbi:hypothetical protein [Paraburkholderia ferrariae]|uniref:hypothetical protein n=1 Tax=Paraburkholderia ferrariae TaxID=386056 RepID=UPI000693B6BE|nr:hypothetical protein [Paraburkholderia ferrariae]